MLDLTHLRSFAAVATDLHFGRAAKRLNMTQPPLSRQIRLLEESLGVQLLERTSHSVKLTPAGRAFLPEAQALLQQTERATQVARRAVRPHSGALSIGFIGASTYGFLPRLVTRARIELPDIELTFKEMSARAQVEALAVGSLDLGIIRPQPGPLPLHSTCVMRETLALALPLDHKLAGRRRPRLEDLDGSAFIMYSPDAPYLHTMLAAAFRSVDVQPLYVQQMSTAQAILSLVSTGMGAAIVPDQARYASFDNIVFYPISLGQGIVAELQAIWRLVDDNPLLPAFREVMHRTGGTE